MHLVGWVFRTYLYLSDKLITARILYGLTIADQSATWLPVIYNVGFSMMPTAHVLRVINFEATQQTPTGRVYFICVVYIIHVPET